MTARPEDAALSDARLPTLTLLLAIASLTFWWGRLPAVPRGQPVC